MDEKKRQVWRFVIQTAISILTAIATALGEIDEAAWAELASTWLDLRRNPARVGSKDATDKIRNVVSVQVPGVPLRPLTAAPRQLPYHDGYVYFELEKGAAAWNDVVKTGALGLHISGTFPDLDMQLWAIRG